MTIHFELEALPVGRRAIVMRMKYAPRKFYYMTDVQAMAQLYHVIGIEGPIDITRPPASLRPDGPQLGRDIYYKQ